jgi:hypothetical protein
MSTRPKSVKRNAADTMRRRSTRQMERIGGGFVGELSEEQEKALFATRAAVKDCVYPERDGSGWFRLDDRIVLRFLRAKAFNVPKAVAMIKDHLKFRCQWRPNDIRDTDPDIAAFTKAGIWEVIGDTNDGHPVELLRFRNYHPADFTMDQFTRAIVFHRERVLEKLSRPRQDPVHQGGEEFILRERSLIIFDAAGWRVGDQGTANGMRQIRLLTDILTNQYCETLGVGCIVFAPAMFRWAWAMIRPWMGETANRVVFVTNLDELHELVDKSTLSKRYGGELEDV